MRSPRCCTVAGGAIVNLASTAGLSGVSGLAAYVASQHGGIGLTQVAALDYAARHLRVNALAPGPIRPPSSLAPPSPWMVADSLAARSVTRS